MDKPLKEIESLLASHSSILQYLVFPAQLTSSPSAWQVVLEPQKSIRDRTKAMVSADPGEHLRWIRDGCRADLGQDGDLTWTVSM